MARGQVSLRRTLTLSGLLVTTCVAIAAADATDDRRALVMLRALRVRMVVVFGVLITAVAMFMVQCGTLRCTSAGIGHGASFVLRVPADPSGCHGA